MFCSEEHEDGETDRRLGRFDAGIKRIARRRCFLSGDGVHHSTSRAKETADGAPHSRIAIADDGIGLPNDTVLERNQSLGLQLVRILIEQLGGELKIRREAGTAFEITFIP